MLLERSEPLKLFQPHRKRLRTYLRPVLLAHLRLLPLPDLHASVKAALFARVARWPGLFYDVDQRVAVAVDLYPHDALHMPGVLALSPESPSTPAEVVGIS